LEGIKSLASLSALGVEKALSSPVVCSSDSRACNMDLSEQPKKNHPSERFSVWESEQMLSGFGKRF